jgi:oligopeptide/dipeptide ABC transporter ATP-binding protein
MLLQVKNLSTYFHTERGLVKAVDDISFSLEKGETLGLVGESGCGKSITALSLLRLIQSPGKIEGGKILFEGNDLLSLSETEMRRIRGNKIAMIFQGPMTSLNPVFTIGFQIEEVIRLHQKADATTARRRAVGMLERVGIANPGQRVKEYPHQLSGGMRQRAMIAMALACEPSLLIADEPTTALDVTVQAQILELLKEIQSAMHMAIIIITHNLGIISEIARRVMVMYAGKVVESAPAEAIFAQARHPYTAGLLHSIPPLTEKLEKLNAIEGNVPNPLELPSGCAFHPRCSRRIEQCSREMPSLQGEAHQFSCFNPIP